MLADVVVDGMTVGPVSFYSYDVEAVLRDQPLCDCCAGTIEL
jgi:hypothetical protein